MAVHLACQMPPNPRALSWPFFCAHFVQSRQSACPPCISVLLSSDWTAFDIAVIRSSCPLINSASCQIINIAPLTFLLQRNLCTCPWAGLAMNANNLAVIMAAYMSYCRMSQLLRSSVSFLPAFLAGIESLFACR